MDPNENTPASYGVGEHQICGNTCYLDASGNWYWLHTSTGQWVLWGQGPLNNGNISLSPFPYNSTDVGTVEDHALPESASSAATQDVRGASGSRSQRFQTGVSKNRKLRGQFLI